MALTYVKPEKIWLKDHPELNERWVQDRIAEDPSLLGLGDLVLKDKDGDVRWDAAETLWRIGPGARAAIAALIDALKHEDRNVRRSAAGALGSFGPEGKIALSALESQVHDTAKSSRPSTRSSRTSRSRRRPTPSRIAQASLEAPWSLTLVASSARQQRA